MKYLILFAVITTVPVGHAEIPGAIYEAKRCLYSGETDDLICLDQKGETLFRVKAELTGDAAGRNRHALNLFPRLGLSFLGAENGGGAWAIPPHLIFER